MVLFDVDDGDSVPAEATDVGYSHDVVSAERKGWVVEGMAAGQQKHRFLVLQSKSYPGWSHVGPNSF